MKLLIDIPEHIYEHAKETTEDSRDEFDAMRAIANGTQGERMNKDEVFDHFIARFKEIDTRPYYKVHDPHWWECYYEIEDLLNECLKEVEDAD